VVAELATSLHGTATHVGGKAVLRAKPAAQEAQFSAPAVSPQSAPSATGVPLVQTQTLTAQLPVKNGVVLSATIVPVYPVEHVQPSVDGTSVPTELVTAAHATAAHAPEKYGAISVPAIVPL